ncbi:MAG: LamG domain-containing protein [Planctomycetota bacterium]
MGAPLMFDTLSATPSAELWTCATTAGANMSPDIWYTFTAPTTTYYQFETCGSTYDTALQLFSGNCGALVLESCNDDSCGVSSRIGPISLNAGDVRYVRVGGFGNTSMGFGTLLATDVGPRPVDLVAHFPLDDTGPNAVDVSGNNLVGVYSGGTQSRPGAAAGTGTSVGFNGAGDHIEVFGDPVLDQLLNDFSVSVWFKATTITPGGAINRIFGNQGPGGSWSFGIKGDQGFRFTTHAVLDYDIAATLVAGQWYHLALTMDFQNDVTFYLDGVNIGAVAGTNQARVPNPSYIIGAWNPPGTIPEFYNGDLDDLQVYVGALSGAEIQQLYSNPGSTIGGNNGIGSAYCSPAVANSTGQPAAIRVDGSVAASANNVTLTASALPLNAFGFFLTSRTQGAVVMPGGSQGTLCLSGSIGRYVGAGQIKNSGALGEFSLALNLAQVPTPTGFVAVQAGDTWNYQAWYRDSIGGVATSNFTNGRSVLFQ